MQEVYCLGYRAFESAKSLLSARSLGWAYSHQISIISSAITLARIMVHLKQYGLSFRTIKNA